MQKILILSLLVNPVWAIVPTIDQHIISDDIATMSGYAASLGTYISRISQVTTALQQVQQLRGLQQIENAGTAICALCSPIEEQHLQTYINSINDDLCSQFSWAMQNITGIAQNISNINSIISELQTNPQAAALALQRSVVQAQISTQNTLAQVQVLMAQQAQKQLAEQKLEKQSVNDTYTGFQHSGL